VTCEALINRFLEAYVAGTLPAARRAEFRLHLALCRACRKYVASYRRTVALVRASGEAAGKERGAPPAELVEAILAITRDNS
jgi:anti-sigma factor RsiW